METERCWLGADGEPGLKGALEISPEVTPLAIRYNTGRRVSDNGSQLASLLEEVHACWPVPVESVALVGHSMGGLVIRSACSAARAAGQRWIDDVSDVVTLGTPHRGAPLEKGTNVVAWGLGLAAETRPLADALNNRSAGIKDLRFGAIAEDDWGGVDPDALLRNSVEDHPLPPDIDHHFVAGVMTSDPNHPVGVVMGDLVVRAASGTGGPHLDPTNVVVLGGLRHFEVLGDPAVIDRVMGWIALASHG
jgi:pimeloyl-ACP methyl ester carboxylesterase